MTRNHGVSRTIPAVTEEYVVTLSRECHVVRLPLNDMLEPTAIPGTRDFEATRRTLDRMAKVDSRANDVGFAAPAAVILMD